MRSLDIRVKLIKALRELRKDFDLFILEYDKRAELWEITAFSDGEHFEVCVTDVLIIQSTTQRLALEIKYEASKSKR